MRNQEHINNITKLRGVIIGYYRSGATVEQMAELSGYSVPIIAEILLSFLKVKTEGLPTHLSGTGDYWHLDPPLLISTGGYV